MTSTRRTGARILAVTGVALATVGAAAWLIGPPDTPVDNTSSATQPASSVAHSPTATTTGGADEAPDPGRNSARETTWVAPTGGYEDFSIGPPGDGLDTAVGSSHLSALVFVEDVGPLYWNSDDDEWWVANPHDSPDEAAIPLLGRDVTVRVEHVLQAKGAGPAIEQLKVPRVGELLTIYVPGGVADIQLSEQQQAEAASYVPAPDHDHGEDETPTEASFATYRYERMPSMALTEGQHVVVFLARELIPQKNAPGKPAWIGVAGPIGSNWVVEASSVYSPLEPDKVSSLEDFATRLDWLSDGSIDNSWSAAVSP